MRVLDSASCAFLFLTAFAGSAGWRAAMLVVCATAVALRWREVRELPAALPRGVLAAIALWMALACASVAWSVDPRQSVTELKPEILYGALAFTVFLLASALRPQLFVPWVVSLLAGAAAAVLAQVLQETLGVTLSRHELDGGAGAYSTHLALIVPLAFALAWPFEQAGRLRLLAAALLLIAAAAWYTGNRVVWVAFAAELAILLATCGRWVPPQLRRRSGRLFAIACLVLVAAFAATLLERATKSFHRATVSASIERDLRPRIWARAWERFQEAPWLGHGFGRELLAEDFLPLTPTAVPHPPIRHAHNTFADMALELGIVGLAAFVAALAALALRYRAMLRRPATAAWGAIGLALLAGFVVKNFTDDFFHRHNALVFWAANGMLLGLAARARAREER